MSESTKEELISFIADLKSEDPSLTWDDIAKRVEQRFHNATGLTGNAIRKRYRVWIRKSEDSKRSDNENQGVETSMSPKTKKQVSPKLPDDLSSYIENYIEEYMRPVIERVIPIPILQGKSQVWKVGH